MGRARQAPWGRIAGGHLPRSSVESVWAADLPAATQGSSGRDSRPMHREDAMDKKAKVPKKTKSAAAGKGKADTVKK